MPLISVWLICTLKLFCLALSKRCKKTSPLVSLQPQEKVIATFGQEIVMHTVPPLISHLVPYNLHFLSGLSFVYNKYQGGIDIVM